MLFNSAVFVVFFCVVTGVYYLCRTVPQRTWWLVIASCVFYMAFIPAYLSFLVGIIITDYWVGRFLPSVPLRKKRLLMGMSLTANIGLLASFKYFNFFADNMQSLLRTVSLDVSIPHLRWILPIGLSFHTFQALSYTIEVYRGNFVPERNFGRFALYVMFYPQLVAGPIERPQNVLPQLRQLEGFKSENFSAGARLMIQGLAKKMIVADSLARMVKGPYESPRSSSAIQLILATIAFALQIYCDFSGYSDIARGTAKVMGVDLMINFNRPYLAKSVSEFWRRWHISLSTWFRDYVYFPLGGSRRGKWCHMRNVLIVFGLSGLWHGANWTYLVWGLLNGIYLVVSDITLRSRDELWLKFNSFSRIRIPLARVTTFALICLTWIFFRAASINDALYILKTTTFGLAKQLLEATGPFLPASTYVVGSGCLLMLTLLVAEVQGEHGIQEGHAKRLLHVPSVIYYGALSSMILVFGIFAEAGQFIYFQF